ncbi:glycosyltransferase [Moraxella sp. VT-16-12]|uniref:glycosyltransferase n=1 Tax=Moraxella sp. VT-16-12 TaxID=2014877 RepID=UPI000B7CCE33|nr:glycosyltransferase [Moraxella sp. VT-16-12]TWV83505.1 glycosyltransferase family 1 protein [Moraxella sp. VT-16-12]
MKNKILIFFPRQTNINAGGPSGFLAHNLVDKPREYFNLSTDLFELNNPFEKNKYRLNRFYHNLISKNIDKETFKTRYIFKKIQANSYKFIFFHEDMDYYRVADLISEKQIVIFQPHCPELHSEEYKTYNPNDIAMYHLIQNAEQAAFNRANIIVLPNLECKPIYKSLINESNQFYYILSGAKRTYPDQNLEPKTLPKNKINLMYIGRRNYTKGFDIVLDSFRKAYKKNPNLNLFIIGSGEKIIEDGIIDIGFSKEPLNWYRSVDYLINANRQSYFDLSIIEAISTGVPIIMSHNFGHLYYQNKSSLIQTYDIDQPNSLTEILSGHLQKRNYQNLENISLYNHELTDECYYARFSEFAKKILGNNT